MSGKRKVGRGHPPVDHQFGRGQKRARGRPKGALGEKAIIQKIAGELHKVVENGETIQVTTYALLLKSMRNLAMSANLRASKWLADYRAKNTPEPDDNVGFLVVPEEKPVDLWIERERFKNRFRTNPELRDDPLLNRSAGD